VALVDKIVKWEAGQMNTKQEVKFFSELVKSGMAWSLQGMYGRRAMDFIEAGIIDKSGKINRKKLQEVI
jgi:hypothetical protein